MKLKLLLFTLCCVLFLSNARYSKAEEPEYYYDDLEATSISVSPSKPMVNQNCVIIVKITNKGNKNIFSNTGLGFFTKNFPDFQVLSTTYKLPSVAEPILQNGISEYKFEGKFLAAGEKQLTFTIDSNNNLTEEKEDNNFISSAAVVLAEGQNDIAINKINIEPEKIILGESVAFDINIKNVGLSSLTNGNGLINSDLLFSVNNFSIDNFSSDSLPTLSAPLKPEAIFTYKIIGHFSDYGAINLNVNVNNNQTLSENNFNNNSSSTLLTVYQTQAKADEFSIFDVDFIPLNSTSTIIKWKTTQPTTATLRYGLNDLIMESIAISQEKTEFEQILQNMTANANYQFYVMAKNNSAEKITPVQIFRLSTDNDNLYIKNIESSIDNAKKTAKFAWQTNIGAYSALYYRATGTESWQSTKNNNHYNLAHEVELKELTAESYEYYLENTDYQKKKIASEIKNFSFTQQIIENSNDSDNTNTQSENNQTDNTAVVPNVITITNNALYEKLKGKILLKVEDLGRAYYVHPTEKKGYFLNTAADAFAVMREQGIGITNSDLAKIPIGIRELDGSDSDGDGLTDAMEDALNTNKNAKDSDMDGYEDKFEITNSYDPSAKNVKMQYDYNFAQATAGKIFLQVQNKGEAWYVNPSDNKRYFLGRPADAYDVMRFLSLGINNQNFESLK